MREGIGRDCSGDGNKKGATIDTANGHALSCRGREMRRTCMTTRALERLQGLNLHGEEIPTDFSSAVKLLLMLGS